MTLGEKLKMYRKQKGVSQEKIAELVGVSRQAVTKWESGQTVPSTENLMALASIYGISLDELAADKKAGGADDRKILHTNLTLIAIILQASFLNAAIQPSQVRETRSAVYEDRGACHKVCSAFCGFRLDGRKSPV